MPEPRGGAARRKELNGRQDIRPVVLIVALTLSATALADVTIESWTIDGEGTMWSTGGEPELSGMFGQPDAGQSGTLTCPTENPRGPESRAYNTRGRPL